MSTTTERTKAGTFRKGNRGGPGRGHSKKAAALADQFRRNSLEETCEALQSAIPDLEQDLASIDTELEAAEIAYLESLVPILARRAKADIDLSRARMAVHYLAKPGAFAGIAESPMQVARREHREAMDDLREAQRDLRRHPEPSFAREAALADASKFEELHRFESARDAVAECERAEWIARRKVEGLGGLPDDLEPSSWGALELEGDGVMRPANRRRELQETG